MSRHTFPVSAGHSKIALVIPARNEAHHLSRLLKKLLKYHLPIVIVDDGSVDATAKFANQFTPYVLSHALNLGKGAALRLGCDWAFERLGVTAVIIMDADEQHDPADVKLFISALKAGHTLVLGVRNLGRDMPKGIALINKVTSLLVKVGWGKYIPDIPSGYKAFTHQAYQQLKWRGSGYEMEIEMAISIAQQRQSFITVPVKTIYHRYIRGMSFLDGLEVVRKMILRHLLTV